MLVLRDIHGNVRVLLGSVGIEESAPVSKDLDGMRWRGRPYVLNLYQPGGRLGVAVGNDGLGGSLVSLRARDTASAVVLVEWTRRP